MRADRSVRRELTLRGSRWRKFLSHKSEPAYVAAGKHIWWRAPDRS